MRKNHPTPRNDEDFEILCLKLLRAYWKCEQLELYSTSGGKQHGVDIIDMSGQEPMRGAQCKLHEEGKSITGEEILKEVEKAKGFTPALGLYVILTTAKRNKDAQDTVIAINREHRQKGLFEVQLWNWSRIEELLDQYTDVRDQYEGGIAADAVNRLEGNIIAGVELLLASRNAEDKDDKFHREIDEARDYVNNGDYQMARLLLTRLRAQHDVDLNPRHKFRILTNLAVVAMGEDEWKRAADLFIEAKHHQPEDEAAQVNEALAYQILGDRERAFELAGKLKDTYPSSERAFGIFVRNAPDDVAFSDIEQRVPGHLAVKGETAVALGQRAIDSGDFQTGEQYLRHATESHPKWSVPWLMLGTVIIDEETTRTWNLYGFDQIKCDPARIADAQTAFETALECAKAEKSKQREREALVNLSRAKAICGNQAEAHKDVEAAYRLAPDDPTVVTFYGQSLRLQGQPKEAIETIRRIPVAKLPHHGRMMLAMLLLERGKLEDLKDAADICMSLALDPEPMKADFREHVIEVGVDSLVKVGQSAKGHSLIESTEPLISTTANLTLQAKLYHLENNLEAASARADEALKTLCATTSRHGIRRLALLLSDIGRHKEAMSLWQQIADTSMPSTDTRRFLEAAARLGRHDLMLQTFDSLRKAGTLEPDLLKYELQLLQTYNTAGAIDVMKEEIVKSGDKMLRLRLSYLGVALDRPDLIENDPELLPSPNELSPKWGVRAVQVLRSAGNEKRAVEFAYELLRRHFDDVDAHRALLAALAPFDPDPKIEQPREVKPGVAVCYREDGDNTLRWIIVEDSFQPEPRLSEYPPDHAICQAMLGKKVGETFVVAQAVQNRTAQITQILSKYVYRYQDCMSQWQVRFPGSRDIQMVKVKLDESGQEPPDISVIQKSVDQRQEQVKNLKQMYQSQNMPLHVLAHFLGTDTFETIRFLASELDTTIKCCNGDFPERTVAASAFRDANTIVLDMSTISTLFTLRRLDVLKNWPTNLVISQATDNELRRMIANEGRINTSQTGVFTKTDQGYGFYETSVDDKKRYVEDLREMVRLLESTCKVIPCTALAALDPDRREALIQVFGN